MHTNSGSSYIVLMMKIRFGCGKETGVVLDSGDGVSHVVPIYEGYSVIQNSKIINFGGRNITEHLRNILKKIGIHLDSTSDF
jgi:actin-related protein